MPFEGEEDLDVELGHIIPGDSGESSDGHPYTLIIWDSRVRGTFGSTHLGDGRVGLRRTECIEGGESDVSSEDAWVSRMLTIGRRVALGLQHCSNGEARRCRCSSRWEIRFQTKDSNGGIKQNQTRGGASASAENISSPSWARAAEARGSDGFRIK